MSDKPEGTSRDPLTAGLVLPNLLNYNGSVVGLDVKLENFKSTSGFRAKHGHEVFLFSPFAEDCVSYRWNLGSMQ